jgi:hypothetical protein
LVFSNKQDGHSFCAGFRSEGKVETCAYINPTESNYFYVKIKARTEVKNTLIGFYADNLVDVDSK